MTFLTSFSMPIALSYLLMVLLSPLLMQYFRPLQLKWPLIFHNMMCTLLSMLTVLLIFVGFLTTQDLARSFFALEVGNDVLQAGIALYWVSKVWELLDTVYMLLRHKGRQMSFLHVFHHTTVLLLADYAASHARWPVIGFGVALNSFVHIFMYGYYALTAFYPLHEFAWKKRITQLQMTQFVLFSCVAVKGYFQFGYCIYSILYPMTMFVLFSNYYYRAFLVKKKGDTTKKTTCKKEE